MINLSDFIQCNIGSCCVHVTGCVNIYLDMCVSLLVIACVLCIFVSVYGIVSVLSKTMLSVENFSKFDALLHKTHSKVLLVLRYQGSTSLGP